VTAGGPRHRLRRFVHKNRGEVEGLLLRRYPAFVLGDAGLAAGDEIPAFAFHDEDEEQLLPMLEFLAANGYRTLTADEYLARRGRCPPSGDREVLLTFDDGHVRLFRVAFPALRRLGLQAVAYVVPGRVPEPAGDGGPVRDLCDWAELAIMHDSGVIDVQSHSHLHHSIAISDRIVDFVRPGLVLSFLGSDLAPLAPEGPDAGDRPAAAPQPGTPVHPWGARYGARPAWREASEVARACAAEVAPHGAAYFARRGWRARLHAVAAAARRAGARGGFESAAEQRAAILADLEAARGTIERRLSGKHVRHFCYPWYQGSPLAARLAREAGMLTHAWGSVRPGFAAGPDAPLAIRRLPPALLWRLPGRGRRPLRRVLLARWSHALARTGRRG
jgi:peptidoglycan/xylan/chitin deacetylase (PgdA/CDA1 family)